MLQASVKTSKTKQLSRCKYQGFDYHKFFNNPLVTSIDKLKLPWIVFGDIPTGHRTASNVASLFAVTVDIDEGNLSQQELILKIQDLGYEAWFYSTYSSFHNGGEARWRVVFPLVTHWGKSDGIETWKSIVKALWQKFDVIPDTACQDPSRLWFSPARRSDQEYQAGYVPSDETLDWKTLVDKPNGNGEHLSTLDYEGQVLTGEHFHEAMRHLTMSLVGQGKNFQHVYTYARDLLDNSDARSIEHQRHLDWQNYRHDLKRLVEGAFKHADDETSEHIEPILTDRLPRFDDQTVQPREHLWQGYLMRKMVTAIVAPGGTGKSMLSLQMAVSCAIGRDLLFEDISVIKCNVLMLNGEDPIEEIARRLIGIKKYYGLTLDLNDHIHIHEQISSSNRLSFLDKEAKQTPHVENTINYCNKHDINVVIIDPVVQFHQVSENANEDIAKLLSAYTQIAKGINGSVVAIHHTRKNKDDPQDNARGASAFRDGCRLLFNMRNMNNTDLEACDNVDEKDWWRYTTLEAMKANYTPHSNKVWLEKDSLDLIEGSDDDYSSFVLQPVDVARIKEDNKEVGEDERMIEAVAEHLIDGGVITITATQASAAIQTIRPQLKAQRARKKIMEILPLGQVTSVKTSKGMMYLFHQESREGRSAGIKFVEK